MPTIKENVSYVTQINHIRVAPGNVEALVARMKRQLDAVVSAAPGFISSSIHQSDDGQNVVNYVQFETADELDAVHETPEFKAIFEEYSGLVLEGGPRLYKVAYVRE